MTLHRLLSQSGNGQTIMIWTTGVHSQRCQNDMKYDAKESGDQLCRTLVKDPMGAVSRRESLSMARSISISSWTLISAVNFGLSCSLKNSLTFAVDASSCYTCVNYLGPVQILVSSCCCKALPFSDAGKLSIRTRQWNLVAVTQRKIITRTCIFEAMITSLTDCCQKKIMSNLLLKHSA